MKSSTQFLLAAALISSAACQTAVSDTAPIAAKPDAQTVAEIEPCLRKVMQLDEGTWTYMGTNAYFNGEFHPYVTTSVHASAGPDTWSTRSFGGDTSAEEAAETGYARVVGNKLIPLEGDELQHDQATTYTSCTGPDVAGRYITEFTYSFPIDNGTIITVEAESWVSEHGSHFFENLITPSGRVGARRSGIMFPVEADG